MQAAMGLLDHAMEQMQALSNAVQRAQAELSDLQRQSGLKDEKIKDLQQAVLLLSSPSGVAAVTPGSIQHSAGETLTFTAGKNVDIGASENLTVAVSQAVSLFAHHNGMKLLAAEGTLQAQAQTGHMQLAAKQDVSVTSTDGQVQIAAAKSLMLVCQGAYIKLEGGTVEIGCPGDLKVRAADFDFQSPASQSVASKLPAACASRASAAAAGGAGVVPR
jgi:type VI secretion system secreted protein VgrG